MEEFLKSDVFAFAVLPVLIFLARVIDVSLGTIRVILVSKGIRALAPVVGFFEVIVWLAAIGQIMSRLDNIWCFLAYALGFSTGTYLGMFIEGRLRIGKAVIRCITHKEATGLVEKLHSLHYGVTSLDAQGALGPVKLIFSIIDRRDLEAVVRIIREFDPGAFYTVGDVRYVSEGIFPSVDRATLLPRLIRTGK